MIREILTLAGFVEGTTFKETRFFKPPQSTYAVFFDSFERRGGDNKNLITDHDYTIELYSYKLDKEAEDSIESVLDTLNIAYNKNPRTWIQEEQLYQVVYSFNYIEK